MLKAKRARELSDHKLQEIEQLILEQCKKGKYTLTLQEELSYPIKNHLETAQYVVHVNYDFHTTTIYW